LAQCTNFNINYTLSTLTDSGLTKYGGIFASGGTLTVKYP
jgi:hypothetical protein